MERQDLNELYSRVDFALTRVKGVERNARVVKQALADALETIGDLQAEEATRENGRNQDDEEQPNRVEAEQAA